MVDRAQVRLADILSEISGIRAATAGLFFDQFEDSWTTLRAVQHGLLIIGEAAKNLPAEMRAERPEIPWSKITALGNFLRHEYGRIDNRRLWDIVEHHRDPLEDAARQFVS